MAHIFWHSKRHQVKQLADYRWVQKMRVYRVRSRWQRVTPPILDLWFVDRDHWNNWNFGTLGTDVSLIRLERSAAVERLEPLELVLASYVLNGAQRLRINPLMVSPSNHWNEIRLNNRRASIRESQSPRGLKKGNKKNSHTNVCAS